MNYKHTLLIVDDDAAIRDLLATYLTEAGFDVHGVEDGDAMWLALEQITPDLIILDLMLPGTDGLTLCRSLTDRTAIPVIMLTARGALIDRIVGLEMGADDYLPKPFDPRELLARIRVVLRRIGRTADPASVTVPDQPLIKFAGWTLDCQRGCLLPPAGGEAIFLGGSDYQALRILLRNPNRTLSRDKLAEQIYGRDRPYSDRAIDMCISRLRTLLADDARNPSIIRTIRNGGYMLAVATEVVAQP